MNLYLISHDADDYYDTFDSAVVAAESDEDARNISPCKLVTHVADGHWMGTHPSGRNKGEAYKRSGSTWVNHSNIKVIKVKYLGTTKLERGLVLSSFNAG